MAWNFRVTFTNRKTKEVFYGRFSSCTPSALSNAIEEAYKRWQDGINMLGYDWTIDEYTETKPRTKIREVMRGNFTLKGNLFTIHPTNC